MEPLSLGLRERVLRACDAGEQTRTEVAGRFRVSVSWVYKLLKQRRDTGSVAPRRRAGGFKSAADERSRQVLRELVAEQPDATLAELRQRLAARGGPAVSAARVCQALKALGLPLKKGRGSPTSGGGRT